MFLFTPWDSSVRSAGDQSGYYSYLPALFIHNDIETLDSTYATRISYTGSEDFHRHEDLKRDDGKHLALYTSGVAIVQLPAFLLAHVIATLSSYPADGFSAPYTVIVSWWPIVLLLSCSLLLLTLLRKYFSQEASTLAVISILLATHIFPNSIDKGNMSHIYLWCLVIILWFLVERIIKKNRLRSWITAGFVCGLIVMMRPSELLILIWFSWFLTRQDFLKTWTVSHFLSFLTAASIPLFIQCLYWKKITGQWIYYSYGEIGFDFKNPFIWEGLFSFQNGFFPYASICLFGLLGLLFIRKRMPYFSAFFIVYFAVNAFVVYSWWNWFYINGYGSRPMIITLVPFAILIAGVWDKLRWKSTVKWLVLGLFVVHNLFTSWQMLSRILLTEESNAYYYMSMMGSTELNEIHLRTLDLAEKQYSNLLITDTLLSYKPAFDTSLANPDLDTLMLTKPDWQEFYVEFADDYSPTLKLVVDYPSKFTGKVIRPYLDVFVPRESKGIYDMNMLVTVIDRADKNIKWSSIKIQNKISRPGKYSYSTGQKNTTKIIKGDIEIPDDLQVGDEIKVLVWNYSNKPTYIREMGLLLGKPN